MDNPFAKAPEVTTPEEPEFDPSLNLEYHGKYNNQTDLVSTLVGGGVAAVADFGASVWNSLPMTPEVSTADILSHVSDNALRVYEEHPDAVEAASFVGGMFLPAGLAMKGMTAARAGVKGANWFSKAGKVEDAAKIEELFSQGALATKEYRAARNAYYAKGAANQLTDAVAMEAAIVLSMNAHPLMEDYMADPVKNFALGAAFGGVIGAGVGHIADRFVVRGLTGAVETKAYDTVFNELKNAYPSTNGATQIQIHEANIQTLDKIVKGTESYDDLTRQTAESILLKVRSDQASIFEDMLSPEVAALPREVKDTMLKFFATQPGSHGVESISFMTQKDTATAKIVNMPKANFTKAPIFSMKTKTDDAGNVISKELEDVVFYPEFGRYATTRDAAHYTRARDLGKTAEQLDKELGKNFGIVPDTSFGEEILSAGAASLDAKYLAALQRVDKMDAKDLAKIALAPDDLPMMNALLARAAKEPDAFENIKFTVTRNAPNYGVVQEAVLRQGGVKSDHIQQLDKITGKNALFNLAEDTSLSSAARSMLDNWVVGGAGDKSRFRAAVDKHLRQGSLVDDDASRAMQEIFASPNRKAFIAEAMKHADAEGNIYLWRGTNKGKAVGHSAVESYSTSYEVAKHFGRPRLYKVHAEDIIGSITTDMREKEILVGSPARQAEAALPVQSSMSSAFAKKASTVSEGASIQDLSNSMLTQKEELVNNFLAQGVPMETIAIRTNTPLDTIKAFAASPEGTSLIEVGVASEYRNAAQIAEYLSPTQRAMKLSSNVNKMSYSQLRAGLDIKQLADMDKEIKQVFLQSSESSAARMIASSLFEGMKPALDMMRAQVGNFVNTRARNKFLTSTDFYVSDMGDAGVIASNIGKEMQRISNETERVVLGPIKEQMAKIVQKPEELLEANVSLNLNASLKGHRIYQDRQFWQKQVSVDANGKEAIKFVPVEFQGKEYKIASDSVDAMWKEMQIQGRELYNMKNAGNKILGKPDMADIGLWVPPLNPKGKFLAYVHNAIDDTTKLLWGNTDVELQSMIKAYRSTVPIERLDKEIKIILPSDKASYNILNGRNDALTMDIANVDLQKRGSNSAALAKINADIFAEVAGGYEHYIGSQTRHLAELALSDVTDVLDRMSHVNQAFFANQALSPVGKMISQPKDTANVIKNTLLGNSNLNEYTSWRSVNQTFETGLSLAVGTVGKAWEAIVSPITKGFIGGKKALTADMMAKVDYKQFAESLEKQGIVNPFKVFDDEAARMFGLAKLSDSKDTSARIIYASNAFAATVALRVGEIAQPIVNAMSLPILTSLAIANKMPATFMGVQKGTAKVGMTQIMYEGMRASNDPRFKNLGKMWEERGYFKPMVSEVNETLAMARGFDGGMLDKVQKALDSKFVDIMSKPADMSETLVRRQTMYTGAVLAKRLYPELDDMGVTIFARDFMDRAVGNYHSAQRPVFFQGTAGVALGLFQTYMVTMAQNIYRGLELKNYKALGKAVLLQSSIFGASSMPGFHPISEAIGDHFSDDNFDLTTGTYRALPENVANLLLYGAPSAAGPALYTRGEINPRFPNLAAAGVTDIVGVNFAMQAADMVKHVAGAAGRDYPQVGQAMLEALSMQSMSRPLARMSEVASGYSVTRQGNTVSTPEEVWTANGIISRILSTRPLEEAKLRQAQHLDSFYGALDRKARQELTGEIKTALRDGNLDDALVARISEAYMRKGGSPTGWRSALNTAIAQSNVSGKATLMDKLDPESPLNFMIENQD